MKLAQCDVCGKVVRVSEIGEIKYAEGASAPVMVKDRMSGDYINIAGVSRDICRTCAIKILQMICPKRDFLPENKYEVK